ELRKGIVYSSSVKVCNFVFEGKGLLVENPMIANHQNGYGFVASPIVGHHNGYGFAPAPTFSNHQMDR
ncbi:hypothetical protein HAX54_025381, partial [Datura stramonium]|nr:hypothetical protein [Datura stramonium]